MTEGAAFRRELLSEYFNASRKCVPASRKIGLEVETLYVDAKTGAPIPRGTSQSMMRWLTRSGGWTIETEVDGCITELRRDGFSLLYEAGWNLFEVVTPPVQVGEIDQLLHGLLACLSSVHKAADSAGGVPVFYHCDNSLENTVVRLSELEALLWNLNGPAMGILAHIASVHLNIDLTSIDEGIEWIRQSNRMFSDRLWPPRESLLYWTLFLSSSTAQYEASRVGPAPEGWAEYLTALSKHRSYALHEAGKWHVPEARARFPKSFHDDEEIDMFLAFIWWWSRLRVRGGMLTIEVRAIPRGLDSDIKTVIDDTFAKFGLSR
jgi:hypothetical protein